MAVGCSTQSLAANVYVLLILSTVIFIVKKFQDAINFCTVQVCMKDFAYQYLAIHDVREV